MGLTVIAVQGFPCFLDQFIQYIDQDCNCIIAAIATQLLDCKVPMFKITQFAHFLLFPLSILCFISHYLYNFMFFLVTKNPPSLHSDQETFLVRSPSTTNNRGMIDF